jgi:hypothetical protein
MFHNKISVFTAYAALVMVGFGGTALLSAFGKSNDTTAVVAFLGFYGFLCTTAIFYVIGKQKATIEALHTHMDQVNDAHWKENENIYRRIGDDVARLEREAEERNSSVWNALDRVECAVEDCTPVKK